MPRGNGTGPAGMGRMTGRAAGYCAGFMTPGFANPYPGFGRGMGMGRSFRGGGYGRRNMFYATGLPGYARYSGFPPAPEYYPGYQTPDPEFEKQMLKQQSDALRSELDALQTRLNELEQGSSDE